MNRNEKLKKYIKKKYYKDDKKVITIHVQSEKELYNPLDGTEETLSDSVTNYLERSAETLLPMNEIKIEIDCPKKIDVQNFEKCLKVYYSIEILNINRVEILKKRKRIFLFLIATIALLSYVFIDTDSEIMNFIATLSIWEYIDMILSKDEEDEIRKYIFEILDDATIID